MAEEAAEPTVLESLTRIVKAATNLTRIERDDARAAIQRVRDLHKPERPPEGHAWIDSGDDRQKCEGCDQGDPYLTPD